MHYLVTTLRNHGSQYTSGFWAHGGCLWCHVAVDGLEEWTLADKTQSGID